MLVDIYIAQTRKQLILVLSKNTYYLLVIAIDYRHYLKVKFNIFKQLALSLQLASCY
jgi:hypothetical protein